MAAFSETCAHNSRKYASGPTISNLNLLEKLRSFWSYFSGFALEKQPQNLNFQSLKESLVATFRETCVLTPKKYVSEPDMIIANLSGIFQFFSSPSSVFILEKKHKNLNFQSYFPLRDPFQPTILLNYNVIIT